MSEVDSSTKDVAWGESVGRTIDRRVHEAVWMNRIDIRSGGEQWRQHLAKRVGIVTTVILVDPEFQQQHRPTQSRVISSNGHGKHSMAEK